MSAFVRSMLILGILALIVGATILLRQPALSPSALPGQTPAMSGRTAGRSTVSHGGPVSDPSGGTKSGSRTVPPSPP